MATFATTHQSLPSDSQAAYQPASPPVPSPAAVEDTQELDRATRKRLICVALIAVVIIITVAVVASIVEFEEHEEKRRHDSLYGDWDEGDTNWWWWDWNYYQYGPRIDTVSLGTVYYACGQRYDCNPDRDANGTAINRIVNTGSCFSELNSTNCAYLCATRSSDYYDIDSAFYITAYQQCYCLTYSQQYDMQNQYTPGITWDTYCINTTQPVEHYSVSRMEIAYGRPYYVDVNSKQNLHADVQQIECSQYDPYSGDEQWAQYVANTNYTHMDQQQEKVQKWIEMGLAEHASIATFSKFSLELMSIAAPLWFIQLANEASLDEIRHTQIAFDIANMFYHGDACLAPNTFPAHEVKVDGDWNKIAVDAAVGGCIGETVSALTIGDKFKLEVSGANEMDASLQRVGGVIAADEIRHSALAWITVKWIIDHHPEVEVAAREWWARELKIRSSEIGNGNSKEHDVYNRVIPSLVNRLWADTEYETLYQSVIEELQVGLQRELGPFAQCRM